MIIENIIYFLKKKKFNTNKNIYIKGYKRNIMLNSNMINSYISIYNGKFFIPLYIKHNMLNYIISSFIFTKSILIKKVIKRYNKKKKLKKK
jgi:ribosomal protein S19